MNKNNLIIMFPDAGAFKWGMKLLDKIKWYGEIYTAQKCRKYENGESKLIQVIDREDFNGKDILIIDDLCVFGGTFIGLASMLRERNVGRLFLAISSITISNPNKALESAYDRIYTTDSKFGEYDLSNLTIFKMDDLKIFE